MHLISVTEYIPISIHALLAESDRAQAAHYRNGQISIHALLAESDTSPCVVMNVRRDFYPRSPCGERRPCRPRRKRPQGISIHALLAESDENSASPIRPRNYFYPRSPCGERRCAGRPRSGWKDISIHALLAESDYVPLTVPHLGKGFLSTLSLRRATNVAQHSRHLRRAFLSTLSLRRATRRTQTAIDLVNISIHALLAESDTAAVRCTVTPVISIHALLAESDRCSQYMYKQLFRFLSTLSLRRATCTVC